MLHVFDRKMLARTPEVAAEWSEKSKVDCITLEGDLCTRKGALSGGYVDSQKSRLKAFNEKMSAEKEYRAVGEEHRRLNAEAKQAEHDVTKIADNIQRLQHKETQISRQIQTLETEKSQAQTQISQQNKQADRLESHTIPGLEREITSFQFDISRLQEEIGTELTDTLSDEDRAQLTRLNEVQEELKGKINDQRETVEEIRAERNRLESVLENNLFKRRAELTQASNDEEGTTMTGATSRMVQDEKERQLEERRLELREATKELEDLEARLEEVRQMEETLKDEVREAKNELERLKSADMKSAKHLDESQRKNETLMGKKALNIGRRDNYMRKIQELGSLPPDSELRSYKSRSIDALEKSLEKVSKKLKKYSHVNKKAFDQYVNFSEKRESLTQRKTELDRGAEKVKELVESLDRKKDEAINRTFRGVSKHFAEVFQELVPLGAGELIMRTALDEQIDGGNDGGDDDDSSGDEDSPSKKKKSVDVDNPDVSLYRGVGIKVRFSAVGENFMMSQLSGGQKALVALALIFAIQRCDPAPFYIFDELDQALDSTYRKAVAGLIQRQANNPDNPTQFITSTFRPELVSIAKNCYGISHQNKVSSVHYMSKNDALKFISNLMSEEEAVGEISTARSSRRESSSRKRKADDDAEEEEEETEAGTTLMEETQEASLGLSTQPV
jgi:structural maintenance of chromosome 3 (chondroitin sulfate proteoglycan 6)